MQGLGAQRRLDGEAVLHPVLAGYACTGDPADDRGAFVIRHPLCRPRPLGFAASFLTGLLFLKTEGGRVVRAIAAHEPEVERARHHVRRITVVERVQRVTSCSCSLRCRSSATRTRAGGCICSRRRPDVRPLFQNSLTGMFAIHRTDRAIKFKRFCGAGRENDDAGRACVLIGQDLHCARRARSRAVMYAIGFAMTLNPTYEDAWVIVVAAVVLAVLTVHLRRDSLRGARPEGSATATDVVRYSSSTRRAPPADAVALLDVDGLHGGVVGRRRAASPSSSPRARAAAAAPRRGRPARRGRGSPSRASAP